MLYSRIKELEIKNLLVGLIYFISSSILIQILLVGRNKWEMVLAILVTMIASIYLMFEKETFALLFMRKKKQDNIINWMSILFAIFFSKNLYYVENGAIQKMITYIQSIAKDFFDIYMIEFIPNTILYLGIVTFFFIVINLLLKKYGASVLKFLQSFCKTEKIYFIVFHVVFISILLFSYANTNVFYNPVSREGIIGRVDVVYTTDTGSLIQENCYMNQKCIENDVRQPLFAVFSFPFAVLAKELANLVPFLSYGYPLFLAIIQVSLLCISIICISRILFIHSNIRIAFLIAISVSYPTFLFAINLEQYIFAVFWLVICMYDYIRKKGDILEVSWIAATGSLITSGAMIFVLFGKNKIESIKRVIKVLLPFSYMIIITGKLTVFLHFILKSEDYLVFTGIEVTFIKKWIQFTYFIHSCFLAPMTTIELGARGNLVYQLETQNTMSFLGIILILALIVSIIVNRKSKVVKLLGGWSVFSVIILLVVGWGIAENGLILYSLYFAFAYFGILFIMLDKLYQKQKHQKLIIIATYVIIALMTGINLYGIWDLICFGIQNYPVM